MKSSLRSTLQCSIIYVVGNLSMSGPNLQFCYLISNLDRARFRPVVVVTSGDEVETAICRKLISLDVEIVYFNVGKVKSLLVGGSRLADICYRMGPAVIHPYGFRSDMLAFFSRHVPRLGSVRNNLRYNYQRTFGLFLGYLISKINLIFLHKTENVISCGTSVQNNLRTLGLESIAIRNSIDIDIYRQMFCSSKVGSTSTRSEKKYLTVASALPGKNVEFLVEQFSRFQAGSRTLIVIGKAAKELLAEFGDHPNIDFRGQVAMPGDALLEADYFISASEQIGRAHV